MAHSFTGIYIHIIFSTKNRTRMLSPELRDRLFPYMGGLKCCGGRGKGWREQWVAGADETLLITQGTAVPETLSIGEILEVSGTASEVCVSKGNRPPLPAAAAAHDSSPRR